jgi:hypothetical protein
MTTAMVRKMAILGMMTFLGNQMTATINGRRKDRENDETRRTSLDRLITVIFNLQEWDLYCRIRGFRKRMYTTWAVFI